VLSSRTISERAGGVVALKAENLQRTGSFKVRGVAAKLAALGEAGCDAASWRASAGNHAQALAAGAPARGVPCEVFVPDRRADRQGRGRARQGATSRSAATSVDACVELAHERAREAGMAFVHPFDDPDVVAGQGSLGLELLEDVPDLARSSCRSAAAGCARDRDRGQVRAAGGRGDRRAGRRRARPTRSRSRAASRAATSALTIADGIAVKRPAS
jgi:threonine dehydratase